jgi:hypothetical protein
MTTAGPIEVHSLVRNDALFRLHRALGLVPATGLGVARRAVFYALLAWLPIALWAWWRGRVIGGAVDEPLLEHFGVHVRCLVAIPLLVIADGVSHAVTGRLLPQFQRSGIAVDGAAFQRVMEGVARLRDRSLPWIAIAGLVVAWAVLAPIAHHPHELLWAADAPAPAGLGFGGWWYLYVSRPIYLALVLGWLWRVGLLFVAMRRIARIELALVPTHPDQHGGLGFLTTLPAAFGPVVFALSAVIAAGWAHQVVYHGAELAALRLEALAFLVVVAAIFLAPLLVFVPVLARTRKRALLDYSTLVGQHGRAVHARWIEHRAVPEAEALLSAPEIGPVADTHAIYDAVRRMKAVPLGTTSVAAVLVPAILPMLGVVALRIPLKSLLLSLVKALT